MHRRIGIFILLSLILSFSTPSRAGSQTSDLSNDKTFLAQNRLVVFEAFMRCTWGISQAAGLAVDQLAQDYADQPVVFIEYDVYNAPSSRYGRWWTAFGGGSATLPLVMVDSGNQISNGYVDFYNVYKAMVDAALARPAQAEIQAHWWRTGDKVGFYVQVKNLSTVTLSSGANSATVHAIVYEDARVKVTNRFARAAVKADISNLTPNATATFTLETSDLSDVNWDNLHYIVLVDYRPSGSIGAYDMLQAAVALPIDAPFTAQPDSLTFMVDPSDVSIPPALVNFQGPGFVNWTAIPSAPWLTTTPSNGPITTQPTVSVIKNDLSTGWQQGNITFTTTDGFFSDQVIINAYLGSVNRIYLPTIVRWPTKISEVVEAKSGSIIDHKGKRPDPTLLLSLLVIPMSEDTLSHYLFGYYATHQPDGVHLSTHCTCGMKLEGIGENESAAMSVLGLFF
jgi:hypothetical protein